MNIKPPTYHSSNEELLEYLSHMLNKLMGEDDCNVTPEERDDIWTTMSWIEESLNLVYHKGKYITKEEWLNSDDVI
jgi:hypothetical protein